MSYQYSFIIFWSILALGWNVNALKLYGRLGGRDMTKETDHRIFRFNKEELEKMASQADDLIS